MHFVLSAALIDRKMGLSQVTDAKAKDPLILDLERKVKMRAFPDASPNETGDNRPDVVTIKTKNGKEYSHGVLRAKGHADVPLTWDELLEKYRDCARVALNDQQAARTIEIMGNLEKLGNIRELMSIVTGMA